MQVGEMPTDSRAEHHLHSTEWAAGWMKVG